MYSECPEPPEGPQSTWQITQSYRQGEFYTGTTVTYKCLPLHEFEWDMPTERTCNRNGSWNIEDAPKCEPR